MEREFTDSTGRRWQVSYTGSGVKGLVTMSQICFRALDGDPAGEERYLTVYPGYIEAQEEADLRTALSQAQPVDPPW